MPDDWIYDPILDVSRKRYAWEMTYEKQEKKEYKPFPKSNKVYHFHPIAFVEQMRRMGNPAKFPITVDQLKQIFPNSTDERRIEVEKAINKYSNEFEIDNIDRMSHFLGQIGTETGELKHLKENYNYSAKTIYNIFLKKVLVPHPEKSGKYPPLPRVSSRVVQ